MDEPNQAPSAEITQAVADSNAAAVASLSTSISGTEPTFGVVSASADLVPLSTSVSTSQEAGGAGAGEASNAPVADASTPANVTVSQAVSPIPISNGETFGSTDAPAVAPVGESIVGVSSTIAGDATANTSGSGTGAPAANSPLPATAPFSTAAEDTGSPASLQAALGKQVSVLQASLGKQAADLQAALGGRGDIAPTAAANLSASEAVAPNAAELSASPLADATLADAGGIPAVSPAAVLPETLLARLHADLEALERKIELGIHVFAHEVAAIREQVKSLI